MKIRSITYFFNPGWPLQQSALRRAREFAQTARPAFEQAGFAVQTIRLATVPFPRLLSSIEKQAMVHLAQSLDAAAAELGYDYISLGPAIPELPESYACIPPALAATQNVFFAGLMTGDSQNGGAGQVHLPAVRACAEVIHQATDITPDGFTNLRFAALANVPPGAPFFPAAYHSAETPAFALAMEAADLAVEAFSCGEGLAAARQRLIAVVEDHAAVLSQTAAALSDRLSLPFGGIDFTLAPFPDHALSFGTAIECLGVPAVGALGSVAAAAILADTLDQASYQRVGFNGLMLPVLEDAVLAQRAAEGQLTVKDLLLYATVCGTGLDTVPLPGDTSAEQIYPLLLDLAALSQRLDKPLTARLMPIPGKRAGDETEFDFAYFANSRVLALAASPLEGGLRGEGGLSLTPRAAHRR